MAAPLLYWAQLSTAPRHAMKGTFIVRILGLAFGFNLILIGAALAATDNVDNQTLVNDGALTVTYTPTEQFMGSTTASASLGNDFALFFFSNLTFTNTTGTSNAWTLSVTTENLQASTGTAAAGTGFNYVSEISFGSDLDSTISFTGGSIGTTSVALSHTGSVSYFGGSGASGSTSPGLDLLTGSGETFNLEGVIDPYTQLFYNAQLPGLYTGTMTFTII